MLTMGGGALQQLADCKRPWRGDCLPAYQQFRKIRSKYQITSNPSSPLLDKQFRSHRFRE